MLEQRGRGGRALPGYEGRRRCGHPKAASSGHHLAGQTEHNTWWITMGPQSTVHWSNKSTDIKIDSQICQNVSKQVRAKSKCNGNILWFPIKQWRERRRRWLCTSWDLKSPSWPGLAGSGDYVGRQQPVQLGAPQDLNKSHRQTYPHSKLEPAEAMWTQDHLLSPITH